MTLGNIIEHIHQRHEPPPDAPSPEIGRSSGLGIRPPLGFALVPRMIIQPCPGIVRVLVADAKLLHGIVYQVGTPELRSVARQERRSHVKPVQPHLMRIDQLVPEAPFQRARMAAQLAYQHVHRFLVLPVLGFAVQVEQHFPRIDEIQVIICHLVFPDGSVGIDKGIAPLFHILVILALAGGFPHLQHRATSYALRIAEEQAFPMVELPRFGETRHFRTGKTLCRFPVGIGSQRHRSKKQLHA